MSGLGAHIRAYLAKTSKKTAVVEVLQANDLLKIAWEIEEKLNDLDANWETLGSMTAVSHGMDIYYVQPMINLPKPIIE